MSTDPMSFHFVLNGSWDPRKRSVRPDDNDDDDSAVVCDLFYPTVPGFLLPQFTLLWSTLYYLAQLPDSECHGYIALLPFSRPLVDRGYLYGVIMLLTGRN
ncbi:hypothetical protein JB92DRAFT_3119769 [Gautieria morchelliformis]|nr:hypothetical protein JB92DRAFT_3119769 [Gautieria morchelliformis]